MSAWIRDAEFESSHLQMDDPVAVQDHLEQLRAMRSQLRYGNEGERLMRLAVLLDAIGVISRHRRRMGRYKDCHQHPVGQQAAEALEWLMDADDDGPFSSTELLTEFGMDPGAVRRVIGNPDWQLTGNVIITHDASATAYRGPRERTESDREYDRRRSRSAA